MDVTETTDVSAVPSTATDPSQQSTEDWFKTRGGAAEETESAAAEEAQEAEVAPATSSPAETTAPESATGELPQGTPKEAKERTAQRFNELLEQRRADKQRIADLEAQLHGKQAEPRTSPPEPKQPAQTEKPRPVRPTWETFDGTYEQYEAALDKHFEDLADWKTEQRLAAQSQTTRESAERLVREAAQQSETRQFAEINREATKRHADYPAVSQQAFEIIEASGNPAFSILADFGLDGALVLYELGKAPDKLKEIALMPPHDAITELAVMRKSAAGTNGNGTHSPAKRSTAAPPPPTSLGTSRTSPADEAEAAVATGDFRRYLEVMNARERKRV